MENPQFQIFRHRLSADDGTEVPFRRSPNQGGQLRPQYLLMHYTAGRDADSSIGWLTNHSSNVSAHLVIGRDGSITQLVDFNRQAWHAGSSEWNGLSGLNRHAIGIELDNAGKLQRRGGRWYSWFEQAFEDDDVVEATHKHESIPTGWHAFPARQIEVAMAAAAAIVRHYNLYDVIGHDDVSPHRKVDPGPAFPMLSFRSRIMGRQDDEDVLFATTTFLNIRMGPGTEFDRLPAGPLPPNTRVLLLSTHATWKFVEVIDELEGEGCGVKGWVSGRFLRRSPDGI